MLKQQGNTQLFIVIEGIEGAGKSSVQKGLESFLTSQNKTVCVTREPGGTDLGKSIRSLLLSNDTAKFCAKTELLLFAADRADHIESIVRPALDRNEFVLCDRFIYSTLAYQGFGRGLSIELINQLNHISTDGLTPDLVLLLDLDVKTGLSRAKSRAETCADESWTRFESEEIAFHQRIRDGFLKLATQYSSIFVPIDATQSAEAVLEQATTIVKERLENR